jgi:HSP20 family protein
MTMNVRDLMPWSRGDQERNAVTRSGAMNPIVSLHREMNRLFDDMFHGFGGTRAWGNRADWPSMDVEEDDKEYRVTAELPGMEERDLEVLLQDGVLTLRGEKKATESRNRTFSECFHGRFERQLALGSEIEDGKVSATFRNGVLTVTIPKSAQAVERTRRIPINAGSKAH